jgi:outer membrane cobalamin receptor
MRIRRLFVFGMCFIGVLGPGFFGVAVSGKEAELGQVVVTATKTEIEISDSPQSISVISKEEIRSSPDQSVGELIQRTPGMLVTQYGYLGSLALPQIRGSTPGQVLVLVNGRRINDSQNGLYDLSALPVAKEDIERIEILRGGASALYGADALGGVINIITISPTEKPDTQVSGSYGRFDTGQFSLVHRWKPGPAGYGISLVRERSEGYRPNGDYDAWILGGEATWEIRPQTEIGFSARYIQKEIGVPGTIQFPDPDDRQKDDNTLLDLTFRSQILPQMKLNLKGFYSSYRNTFDPGSQGIFSMGPTTLSKNQALGGDLQAIYAVGETQLLTGGMEAIEDRVNSSAYGVKRATRGAFYLQDEIEIGRSLTTTLGLRYDFHSIYEEQWNPRLGVLWRLPAEVRVRGSVGRLFRAPTFNDLYWPATAWTAGNPDLKPESAWNYEVGVEKTFGNWGVAKIAGFYREVEDLINWAAGPDFVWRPSNISSAEIWGVEFEGVLRPAKGWSIPLNYSYLYPRDGSTGDPIPFRPKHMINLGVAYDSSLGIKANLKGRYVQYYLDQTTTLNQNYFVVDARVGYEFKISLQHRGEVFLNLSNAFDKEYQVVEGYPMPPRALSGGVNFSF